MFANAARQIGSTANQFRWVGPAAVGIGGCIPAYFVYDHYDTQRQAKTYEKLVRDRCYLDIGIGNRYAGRIIVGLYSDTVPLTCENFVQLCKGYRIKERIIGYQNTNIHLIKSGCAIAGGDVLDGTGRTRGLSIYGEAFPDENFEIDFLRDGDLAMCNWGKNTNSSIWMITLSQQRAFTNHHVCFGTVMKGMRVVREIGELGTRVGRPAVPIRIVQCGVLEDGKEPPPPPSVELEDDAAPLMTEDEFRSISVSPGRGFHPLPGHQQPESLAGLRTGWQALFATAKCEEPKPKAGSEESAGSEDEPSKLVSAPVENAWERTSWEQSSFDSSADKAKFLRLMGADKDKKSSSVQPSKVKPGPGTQELEHQYWQSMQKQLYSRGRGLG